MSGMLVLILFLIYLWAAPVLVVRGEDPYLFFTWNITYGTIAPLGVSQTGILINGMFPGPNINSTSNNNVVVNIFNHLDEPFLMTWSGVQHRKNSWQDGVLGTNCPIPPGKNWTYHFQVKDQIGSYQYYPSMAMHKASGGFGGLQINSRELIPVPYPQPAGDFTVLIGDWYKKGHAGLKRALDDGRRISRCDGVHINGKNANGKPLFTMEAGKTYRYRLCNVGIKTSLNFGIQGHKMKLVELEGSHVMQNVYDSLDVHVGMCFALLVEANQKPKDYYLVASTRFTKRQSTATAIVNYKNGKGKPSAKIPSPPAGGWSWSLNQFRSFRWNLTASAARPNPQGSYHYGSINITRTIKLVNTDGKVNGKQRYGLNGASYVETNTPLKLAEYFEVPKNVFKYNGIKDNPPANVSKLSLQTTVLNLTHRAFIEIIFENHEKSIQSYHLDGYSFFAVGVENGKWDPSKRKNYNLLDAVNRHTIQVFPHGWAAILLTFDNCGIWNIRSEIWDRHYLGQQLYISVITPERSLRDEYNIPDNSLLCGVVKMLPKPKPYTI